MDGGGRYVVLERSAFDGRALVDAGTGLWNEKGFVHSKTELGRQLHESREGHLHVHVE